MLIWTVKPVAVDVVASNVGVNAAASEVAVTGAELADGRPEPTAFFAITLIT